MSAGEASEGPVDDPYDKVMPIYRSLMEEMKIRLAYIGQVLKDRDTILRSPHGFVVAESCYLQMRFACENIALAIVVAHEPLGIGSRLLKAFDAHSTFKILANLNPAFFPKPVRITDSENGGKLEFLEPLFGETGFSKIYGVCGDRLHRGPLSRLLKGERRIYSLDEVEAMATDVLTMLHEHVIMFHEDADGMTVRLEGGAGGSVFIETFRRASMLIDHGAA